MAWPLCSREATSPGDSGQAAEHPLALFQGARGGSGLPPGEWVGAEMQDSREASSVLLFWAAFRPCSFWERQRH